MESGAMRCGNARKRDQSSWKCVWNTPLSKQVCAVAIPSNHCKAWVGTRGKVVFLGKEFTKKKIHKANSTVYTTKRCEKPCAETTRGRESRSISLFVSVSLEQYPADDDAPTVAASSRPSQNQSPKKSSTRPLTKVMCQTQLLFVDDVLLRQTSYAVERQVFFSSLKKIHKNQHHDLGRMMTIRASRKTLKNEGETLYFILL